MYAFIAEVEFESYRKENKRALGTTVLCLSNVNIE